MNRLLVLVCLGLIVHQGCCQNAQMLQRLMAMQALGGGGNTGGMMGMPGMTGAAGAAGAANFMENMREQPALMRMFLQSQRSSPPAGTGGVPSTTGTSGATGGFPSTGMSYDPVVMAVMSGQGSSISNEHQFVFQSLASGSDMRGRPATLAQNLANALGNSGSGVSKDQQQTLLVKAFQEGHLNRLLDATGNLQDQMDLERRGLPGVAANKQMQMLMCPMQMNMRCGFQFCQDYETPYTPESFYNCQGCPRCRMETGGLNVLRSLRRRRNNPFARMAAMRHLSQNQGANPLVAQLVASSLNSNYNNVPVAPMQGIQYQPPPPVRNNQGQQQQGYQMPPGSYPPQQGPPPAQQGYPPQQGPPPAQGYPPQQGPPPEQQGYQPRQAPPQTRQGYPPQQGPLQTRPAYPPRQGPPSQYQPGQGPPPGYAPPQGPPPGYAPPQGPPPGYAPPPPGYATPSATPQSGPPPRQQKPSRGPPPPGPKPSSEFITAIKKMGQTMARQQKAQNPKAVARSRA